MIQGNEVEQTGLSHLLLSQIGFNRMCKEYAGTKQSNHRNDELKHGSVLKQRYTNKSRKRFLLQECFVAPNNGFVQFTLEPERRFLKTVTVATHHQCGGLRVSEPGTRC